MLFRVLFAILVLLMSCSCANADDDIIKMKDVEPPRQLGYPVKTIMPIFNQLLMFSFPDGFKPVFESVKPAHYMQESVLEGEDVNSWSQMITVTGTKGMASNPKVTPNVFANHMAGNFKAACPATFGGTGLGSLKVGNHDAYAALIGCGIANPKGLPYSESMLLIVIKGSSDYYTIQWAIRDDASSAPLRFDEVKWTERMKSLIPIKLCPVIRGETAPYPSCYNR